MLRQRFRKVKATKGGTGVVNNYNFPPHTTDGATKQNKLLKSIWWPKKKPLIESLHERRIGDKFLVDELHDLLMKDKNRMVVIRESVNAAKLTGMGGIGKTLTVTWYAHKYEHKYDHVMWIDCGEGSLLASFQKLARDLDVKNRTELVDEEDFSTKSYEKLMEFKCLWIFDNAENYKGQGGIIRVLPKYMENFSCLITTRSRDWRIEKRGYGKISDLQLNIFSAQESMDFFEDNLKREIKYTEFQLRELCRLLGNLPLAMQLAVAALNECKIDLENYIEKTSAEDVKNIVDAEFGDYEKTINASVKIILDVLKKEENGIVAKDILNIFGYIQPDDVIIDLFQEVLKLSFEEVNKGILLLEKYSLISKKLKTIDKETKLFVNIHRLLQQVVRHNCGKHEKETLKNILGCEGFVDYKLLPFTKYTDEELRKQFPKVKVELMDQKQLLKLVREKKWDESLQLSKFIDQELQQGATKFNYAICLEMNGQLEDNIRVLEELYNREMKEEIMKYELQMGLLNMDTEVTKSLVGGHLLVSLWTMDNNNERLKEILEERKSFVMIPSQERMTPLVRILYSNVIHSNYTLTNEGRMLKLVLGGDKKRIELWSCSVDLCGPLLRALSEMQKSLSERVHFTHGNPKDTKSEVSQGIPKKLNTLEVYCGHSDVSLESISSIENITLSLSSLSLDSVNRMSPAELKLNYVSFIKSGQEISNFKVNEFIDFHKMKRLQLISWNDKKKKLSIDLSEESANMEYLYLRNVTVVSLKSADGNGRVSTREAEIANCSLDLSVLPPSIEKLSLLDDTKVFVSGGIDLPNLKYLKLEDSCTSALPHFLSVQLSYLCLHHSIKDGNAKATDLSGLLPKQLNALAISCLKPKQILLSLRCISSIENITLSNCSLSLDSVNRISPKQLRLENVFFVKNGKELSNVKVTEFIDFHKMNRLELICTVKGNLSIDLREESANIEYLHLDNVIVVSLKSADGDDDEKVHIKESKIENCLLDLSILPSTLEKISLFGSKVLLRERTNDTH